jgi:protein-tyrosine phosphatase
LSENFPIEIEGKKIIILDIPDEYKYMDEELIEEIQSKVDNYFELNV